MNEIEYLRQQVAEAETGLRSLREKRQDTERAAAELGTLQAAIRLVSRDIDAGTSPTVETLIDEITALDEEVAEAQRRIEGTVFKVRHLEAGAVGGLAAYVDGEVIERLERAIAEAPVAPGAGAGVL